MTKESLTTKKKIIAVMAITIVVVFILLVFAPSAEEERFGIENHELSSTTADRVIFYQYFSTMDLRQSLTSQMADVFNSADTIRIVTNCTNATDVWFWVDDMVTGVYADVEIFENIEKGIQIIDIGKFDEGKYVVRVLVKGDLVRNLPFEVVP